MEKQGAVRHSPIQREPIPDIKGEVSSDLAGAAKMLDQALRRLQPSLEIYKSIKEVDDLLDSVLLCLQKGDYDGDLLR